MFKKTSWKSKAKKTYKSKSKAVNKVVNSAVKKALYSNKFIELKRNRSMIATTATAGTEIYANLCTGLQVGTSDLANRIGDRINLKDIRLRGHSTWSGAGVDTCRIMVFLWNDDISLSPVNIANASPLLFDDIGGTNQKLHCQQNFDVVLTGRYKILYDKSFQMSESNTGFVFDKVFKLEGKRVQGISGNSFTTQGQGLPHIMYLSNAASSFVNYMTVRYTDL